VEKISGILPASPRIKSVDTSDSSPARPGAPLNGRKEGRVSARDRISISPDAKEIAFKQTMGGKDPQDVSRAKMVSEINKRFFETRFDKPESPSVATQTVENLMEQISSEDLAEIGKNLDTQA
jgi:hypothetical protein